jgi:hypothetical protein
MSLETKEVDLKAPMTVRLGKTFLKALQTQAQLRLVLITKRPSQFLWLAISWALEDTITFRAAWGYIEEDVSGHFVVDRIDMDENQNAWYLPLQSKAVAYRYGNIYINGTEHKRLFIVNLPQEGYKYKSALCGNRIIVFTHNLGARYSGGISSVYYSDDFGINWQKVDFSINALMYVKGISFNGNFGVLVGLHHGGYATGPRYTSDAGITWSKESTVAGDLRQFPASVFADFDGTNYRSIIVGQFHRVFDVNQTTRPRGYIQIDSLDVIETNTARLNYITMKNDKFLIVGDSGVVLLGQRVAISTKSMERETSSLY